MIPAGIALITILVFSRTLTCGFTNWDDYINVTKNPFLNPPALGSVAKLWIQPYRGLYIPLTYTALGIDRAVAGNHAWFYHAVNAILHAVSAMLVYFILRLLLRYTQWKDAAERNLQVAAVAGTLVFALHPIQVEAVSWVTGRKDVLSGMLCFAALLLYLSWFTGSRQTVRLKVDGLYIAALLAYALANLAKPAFAFPFVPLALAWLVVKKDLRSTLLSLAPWFAIGLTFAIITTRVQVPAPDMTNTLPPTWTRPFVAAFSLCFYLLKTVVPVGLATVYGLTPSKIMSLRFVYVTFALVLAGAFVLISGRHRVAKATSLWFLAPILPLLGFVPFSYQAYSAVADRYVYVSMAGVGFAVAGILLSFAESRKIATGVLIAATLLVLCTLAAVTFHQIGYWKSSETLWKRAATTAPKAAVTHSNLGEALALQQRYDEAQLEFTRAIELEPRMSQAWMNRGLAYLRKQQPALAIEPLSRALDVNPTYADAAANLGDAYGSLKKNDDATSAYLRAIANDPNHAQARTNLATLYTNTGHLPEAEAQLREISRRQPYYAMGRHNHAIILVKMGRMNEAVAEAQAALRLNPQDREAAVILSMVKGN